MLVLFSVHIWTEANPALLNGNVLFIFIPFNKIIPFDFLQRNPTNFNNFGEDSMFWTLMVWIMGPFGDNKLVMNMRWIFLLRRMKIKTCQTKDSTKGTKDGQFFKIFSQMGGEFITGRKFLLVRTIWFRKYLNFVHFQVQSLLVKQLLYICNVV